MSKPVIVNILMNLVLTGVFIFINNLLLQNQFEESFISTAILYGFIVTVANAFYISKYCKK